MTRQLDLEEGVDHVRRLLAQQEKGKVWKHRLKIAELEIQIFLASIIVKPYDNTFWSVFRDWCEVMIAVEKASDLLIQMVQKYLQLSESSQHVYTMASILHQKFGESYDALVIELLIRALTRDMNALETIKLDIKEGNFERQTKLEHQMADGFMDLSAVFERHIDVARECVLTAFSLHPTTIRLNKLKEYSVMPTVKKEPVDCVEKKDLGVENDISAVTNHTHENIEETVKEVENIYNLNLFNNDVSCKNNPTNDMVDKIMKVPIIDTGQTLKSTLNDSEMKDSASDVETVFKSSSVGPLNTGITIDLEGIKVNISISDKENSNEIDKLMETKSIDCELNSAIAIKDDCNADGISQNCNCDLNSEESVENCAKFDKVQVNFNREATPEIFEENGNEIEFSTTCNNFSTLLEDKNNYDNDMEGNMSYNNKQSNFSDNAATSWGSDFYEDIKLKNDSLSLDDFFASADLLIEQLNQEKKEKSEKVANNKLKRLDILSAPQEILNVEELGLSKELCDDLAVVLSSPRWQVLSWALDKSELLLICEKYFANSDSAKNVTKELKFLNIDYNQFKHLPSEEVDEFTGIEKGYEHFMDEESDLDDDDYYFGSRGVCNQYSSGSEVECTKRVRGVGRVRGRRGRPPLRGRFLTSDSDSTGRSKSRSMPVTSLSESDDSDFGKFTTYKNGSKNFEGKRITAVSCNDRRKRLKIDATTGQVRQSRGSVNHLRLYRHDASCTVQPKIFGSRRGRPPKIFGSGQPRSFAPSLGSVNLNPSVVLTHYNQSPIKEEVKCVEESETCKSKTETNNSLSTSKIPNSKPSILSRSPFQRGANHGSWRYAGYLVSDPEKDTTRQSSVSILPSQQQKSVKCSYRTREGRVVTLNTHNFIDGKDGSTTTKNYDYSQKLINGNPSTTFQDSFAKFLLQKNPDSKTGHIQNLANRKNVSLESNLEYLKRQGTSVIFKKKTDSTSTLENAQKNVLSRIMSPENSIHSFHRSPNLPLPVRAIAMPVSHNPPNLPPNDKTNPVGLSRVLPKGTTVVRRPKPESGAGTSGLNNGGSSTSIISTGRSIPTQQRPAISITPSNSFIVSSPSGSSFSSNTLSNFVRSSTESSRAIDSVVNLIEGAGSSYPNNPSTSTENENFSPLAVATVVGSVSQTTNPRSIININSPGETQGGSFIVRDITLKPSRAVTFSNLSNLSRVTSGTTTTTVASYSGETRAPSMLESLLRDRPTPTSPILLSVSSSGSPAATTTTSSIHEPLVASSARTGTPLSTSHSDGGNYVTNLAHASDFENNTNSNSLISASSIVGTSNFMDSSSMGAVSISNVRSSPIQGITSMAIVGSSMPSSILTSSALTGNVIVSGVTTTSAGANSSGIFSGASLGSSVVTSNADIQTSGMHQLLLPAQLFQVQQTDGSTGLSIVHSVHSGSLDLRLPPGTRVIKSPSNIRQTPPIPISQPNARPLNVLHNLKIVQNRQIVRTVVVPHSVALQSLGSQQAAQLVALSQSPSTSNIGGDSQSTSKIPTQLHKMLGHNVVPGGLVIRAVRSSPDVVIDDALISKPHNPTTIIHHTADNQQKNEKMKEAEKSKVMNPVQPQEEGLAERLSRHYLKTALLASSNTQSVGTQTQTTAVKPVTGQLVNQVVMNHLRGITSSGAVPIVTPLAVASSAPSPSTLNLGSANAVSSETLEQLREFESVFEKVSNKSVKENDTVIDPENFSTSNVSSEESMIAAQLLSMANETPPVTTASSYVYTVPTSGTENLSTTSSSCSNTTASTSSGLVGTCLGEGTFITIPCTTQPGTLILVNPSASASGIVTMSTASGSQTTQPPPAASPALSSTSSHSSIASSPSSTSSKSKSKTSKVKVSSLPSSAVSSKPKSPPPPKVPPKPAVAKPQVEESDETKARIQAILDRYKLDLANTPQPQPAPRNRKNCPPPKNEGKSSSKKKSSAKKLDSGASGSPSTSDSGHLPSVSPSPAPLAMTPSGEDSEGSIGGTSTCSQFQDDKPKSEESLPPQILQGVVVSNMKVDGTGLGTNITTLPQGLAGGRVVQFIRHGSKVTAITTRQPFQKAKGTLTSGGPPPNVTIQGRINMNDLMESHLATLLAGGSATINQNSPLITKLIQAQQQSPTVQQLVVQTTTAQGQQVLQQVSLQSVIAAHAKQQLQVVTGRANNEPSPSLSNSPIKTPQPHPSPCMSSGCISASPGTPQHRVSSPSTPSPAPDLPHTPSFQTHEEDSNSSVQSHEGGPAGPLPPFFTLTKQFMSPHQNQQFREKSVSEIASHSSVPASPEHIRSSAKLINNTRANRPTSVNSGHSQSYDRSEITFSKNLCLSSGGSTSNKSSITANIMFHNSAPSSPLVNSVDNVLDMSPVSEPSSIESSPSIISQRLPALNSVSELRCNSLDSVKSDLSVEEVQIPPSPATLTKQLQNAYMTEAALSPAVSQSHMSNNSSYSSPTTAHDLAFAETSKDHRALSPNLGHPSHTYSLAGTSSNTSSLSNVSNCSTNNNNHVIDNTSLACLSSPSGDVYLDQAGVGLGLDGLPLVEGRPQSPSLSDLVPAVPLLSWSPRSADSIMGQSPSLNDALTGNMTLDVHHSEDSLCDSSTGFPGLFSMEGDGASVSSSTSEEMHSSLLNSSGNFTQLQTSTGISFPSVSSHSHLDDRLHHCSTGKKLPNHEQDQTISSTRCEDISSGLALQLVHSHSKINIDLTKKEGSCSSVASEDELWRSTERELQIPVESEDDGDEHSQHSDTKKKCKKTHTSDNERKDDQSKRRRRSQRQTEVGVRNNLSNTPDNMAHNGYDDAIEDKNFDVKKEDETSCEKPLPVKINSPLDDKEQAHSSLSVKCASKDGEKPGVSADHKQIYQDNITDDGGAHEGMSRQTRGMKRRSDSDFNQDDKKCKSFKSRRSLPEHKQDDKLSTYDDGTAGPLTRNLRNRHISGTSDSSSNFSMDRVSTPGLQDSPMGSGSSTVRKRRGSHDSSVSSRDSSPLTVLLNTQNDGSTNSSSGVHTRRSSSRDHAKKTRCRCCGDQQQSSQGGSSRRTSGRVSRGSGPSNS